MSNAVENVIGGLILALITIAPVYKDVFKKSSTGFPFSVTKLGIVLIVASIFYIGFNFKKDYASDKKIEQADNAKNFADSVKNNKDSLLTDLQHRMNDTLQKMNELQKELKLLQLATKDTIKSKVESSAFAVIKASNRTIRQYNGLLQDSLSKLMNKINAQQNPIAEITLDSITVRSSNRPGVYRVTVYPVVINGPATKVDLHWDIVNYYHDTLWLNVFETDIYVQTEMMANGRSERKIYINADSVKPVYIRLHGSWFDKERIRQSFIDDVFEASWNYNIEGVKNPPPQIKKQVLSFIENPAIIIRK